MKYKYGKIDEYQSKIKDDVPERDEGWFKHKPGLRKRDVKMPKYFA